MQLRIQHLLAGVVAGMILILTSCSSGSVMTRATGLAYEMIVVMDRANWNGAAGEAVKDDVLSDVPGLNQSEPGFRITYVTPGEFNGLFTYVRNILIVRIDDTQFTQVSVNTEANRWSNGQVVMTINSPDAQLLVDWLNEHPRYIADQFTKVEMERTQEQLAKNYSLVVEESVREMFDIYLRVPSEMTYSKRATDFFWASNNANTGRTDVVVYSFPYTDANTFTLDYLVAKRDSVLKENVPASFPDSYMATEKRSELTYTPLNVRGKYVGEVRGLWKAVNDMMGGPFVSHVRLDEANNRVIVVEGFVYAPETNKRNFIRRIEAALYTLRLPGDSY